MTTELATDRTAATLLLSERHKPARARDRNPPDRDCHRDFSVAAYAIGRAMGRFVRVQTMNVHTIRADVPERPGGYVLSLTHLGHLDPLISCVVIKRRIRWMARKEFFKYRAVAWLLRTCGCF